MYEYTTTTAAVVSLCESDRKKVHNDYDMSNELAVSWRGQNEFTTIFMVFTKVSTGRRG